MTKAHGSSSSLEHLDTELSPLAPHWPETLVTVGAGEVSAARAARPPHAATHNLATSGLKHETCTSRRAQLFAHEGRELVTAIKSECGAGLATLLENPSSPHDWVLLPVFDTKVSSRVRRTGVVNGDGGRGGGEVLQTISSTSLPLPHTTTEYHHITTTTTTTTTTIASHRITSHHATSPYRSYHQRGDASRAMDQMSDFIAGPYQHTSAQRVFSHTELSSRLSP